MLRGGCYCGAVKYEIHGKLLMFVNCHCPDCRKFSGSAFSSVLATEAEGFKLVTDANELAKFESSPGKHRHFCNRCGTPLFSRTDHRPGMVFVRAGSLDDDPQIRPQAHFWTTFKAPWHEIFDGLPQYPEGLPAK